MTVQGNIGIGKAHVLMGIHKAGRHLQFLIKITGIHANGAEQILYFLLISLGYPAHEPAMPKRKETDEIAFFNTWEAKTDE